MFMEMFSCVLQLQCKKESFRGRREQSDCRKAWKFVQTLFWTKGGTVWTEGNSPATVHLWLGQNQHKKLYKTNQRKRNEDIVFDVFSARNFCCWWLRISKNFKKGQNFSYTLMSAMLIFSSGGVGMGFLWKNVHDSHLEIMGKESGNCFCCWYVHSDCSPMHVYTLCWWNITPQW